MKSTNRAIIPAKSILAASIMAAVASTQAATLEEILVTAQKREQNLQDVPVSVTALTADFLKNNGVHDISRLELLTPGLQFGQSGTDPRPAIRGTRTESISVQQDPIVAFFVDGVYRSRTSQALASFVDINRVEILRGPQGTLFGRNSFGGAISVFSNRPSQEKEYGAALSVGNYDQRRLEGYFNAPLSDTVALRLASSVDQHDFYVENSFNRDHGMRDKDETYIRAQIGWDVNRDIYINLAASSWTQGGNGSGEFGYYNAGRPFDEDGGGFTSLEEILNARLEPVNPRVGAGFLPSDTDPYVIARDYGSTLDTEQDTIDLNVEWDFDWSILKIILAYSDFSTYRDSDGDLSILESAFAGQIDTAETFSQEFQLSSAGDGDLQWTVGAYFLQDETVGTFIFDRIYETDPDTNRPDPTKPAPDSDFNSRAEVDVTSNAFFGQATYSLTDSVRLTAGVRYTEETKDFTRYVNFSYTDPLKFDLGNPSLDTSEDFDKVTWRAGVDFDFSEDTMIYATASTGFQSGGFNTSPNPLTGSFAFDAQEITAYEIGSKSILLDGTLQMNLAVYLNEFDDMLATVFVDTGTTVVSLASNAGEATAMGAEAEIDWLVGDNARFNIRASYTDAEFGTYTLVEPVSGITADLDGSRIPMTPDFTIGIGGEYDFMVRGGVLTPAFNVYHSSDYSTNDFDWAFAEQDAYTKLDLTLTYSADDGWYVQAYGRNVTDEEVLNRTVRFGQNLIAQNYNDPMTYGVKIGFNY